VGVVEEIILEEQSLMKREEEDRVEIRVKVVAETAMGARLTKSEERLNIL